MYYELYILACLIERSCYGYELKKRMQDGFSLCTTINNNTIYPLLKKYEKNGYATKELQVSDVHPNRYLYHITEKGCDFFLSMLNDVSNSSLNDRDQFIMRLSYFHFITMANRQRILVYRRQFLENGIDKLKKASNTNYSLFQPRIPENHQFHLELLQLELHLLEQFEEKINEPVEKIK